jgi:O-antigen ligase
MEKINFKNIGLIALIFLVIEVLSFLAFSRPVLNGTILAILSLVMVIVSAYRLEYGFLMLLSELFIGSMGHFFFINFTGGQLPLRIAIWSAFIAVFLVKFIVQLIKDKKESSYWRNLRSFSGLKYFIILGVFITIGLINGFIRGHALGVIFSDFNSWLFFLLIIPAAVIYGGEGEEQRLRIGRLTNIFFVGALWMSFKTLIFLFIFTHNSAIAPDIYTWLRKTLNGEMTPTLAGWPRIFIQGQIYAGSAFFLSFWNNRGNFKIKNIFISGLFLSTLIISFSRSFWAGLAIAIFFSLIIVWRLQSFKKMIISGIWLLASLVFGFIIIYAVAAFPYIYRVDNFGASFLDRVSNSNEAAVASRWSLLPALMKEIKKEPFLGQGYGATVTYRSSDPRVLQTNPNGIYTTYAFEWGYLELWLKLGLLGLAAYLWLLFGLVRSGIKNGLRTNRPLFFGLAAGLIFLVVTNIFTPYLNHPLGIGIVVLSSCLIRLNKIY